MPLLPLEDLEADSKISRHTWREWIRAGKIATIRGGRSVCVSEADYRSFVERCRVPARRESHD